MSQPQRKHYHWVRGRPPHRNTPQTHPQLSPHANMITLRPRTAFEQANTKVAIKAGIAEANNQDEPALAAVLRQLYEESLHYHVRTDLLDAVISGNMTAQQHKDFVSLSRLRGIGFRLSVRRKTQQFWRQGGRRQLVWGEWRRREIVRQ